MKIRRPCSNCPWRVDAPRQYWDPQHFRDIWKNCQDDGSSRMLCHKTPDPRDSGSHIVCQGWLRVMGPEAIGVRIALVQGVCTLKEVEDLEGPELFESFEAMLRANDIEPPPRNVFKPD